MSLIENSRRIWIARILIGLVFFWNIQCALAFILWPERFSPGFELSGAPGAAAIRGLGVLFLMWNVPYAVALWQPVRQRWSLYEAIAMQGIGLVGESLIFAGIPVAYSLARSSVLRFIAFDGAGLLALAAALWITHSLTSAEIPPTQVDPLPSPMEKPNDPG
jgi:hypothetical protein